MWFPLLVILICFIVFERASNYLVEGLGAISQKFGISEAVLGASIAAMGSSAPEFGSSVFSVVEGYPTIGLGTIVGSAIFNVTVIIGGVGLFGKYVIEKRVFYRDGLFYLFTVFVAFVSVYDGVLSRYEAIFWVLTFIFYMFWLFHDAKKGKLVPKESFSQMSFPKAVLYISVSILAIAIAARYLVTSTAEFSARMGISEAAISLIVIAAGTSVPDFFTSLQAARKGMGSLAVSNALGSNIFDILAAIGIPFSFRGSTEVGIVVDSSIVALFLSVIVLLALLRRGWSITKKEAVILLVIYAVFVVSIVLM